MAVFQKLVCGERVGEDGHVHTRNCRGGKYYIEYYCQGRKIAECTGYSKKAAERALAVRKTEILQGRYSYKDEKDSMLFEDFAQMYMEEYSRLRKRSYKRDELSLKTLIPFFKGRRLAQITPHLIEKYQRERKERVSGATVNRELALVKNMFSVAMRWGKAVTNPVKQVKFFHEEWKSPRILSEAEEERLLQNTAPHLRPVIITALHTGMRKSELLSLKWDNVDFDKGIITLEASNTKSRKMRYIKMNRTLTDVLLNVRINSVGTEYVFCNQRREPYCMGNRGGSVRTAFRGALRRARIEKFRFHDLRHTCATRLAQAGATPVAVQHLLGHQSLQTTQRYFHVTEDHMRDTMDLLDRKSRADGDYMATKQELASYPIAVSY